MSEPESHILPLDAPVSLAELLRPDELSLLSEAEEALGLPVSLIDRDGQVQRGPKPAADVLDLEPGVEPLFQSGYLCAAVYHDGERLCLICTPCPQGSDQQPLQRFLLRLTTSLLLTGLRRTLAARLHIATVEESYAQLQEKNQRLEQAIGRMQELDRIKANFLATVSHELRTPLTSVIGYSEMLMEGLAGPLNDEQREYLRTVMDKGEQLLHLITGILDISRIESSGVQLSRSEVDLAEIIRDVQGTVAPQARRKKLKLVSDVEEGLPRISADRDKLRQVLLNLCGNAIKFTQKGTVTIRAHKLQSLAFEGAEAPLGPCIEVAVCDTGIGIPVHLHEKIFDPFYQVDNSSTREYEGTGLGLSIVRKFIEAHGGRVWVKNNKDEGVTFHFALPLSPLE